jgi:hypothetical protein
MNRGVKSQTVLGNSKNKKGKRILQGTKVQAQQWMDLGSSKRTWGVGLIQIALT